MKTTNSLALVLALALGATATGCSAADPSAAGGDDDGVTPGGGDDDDGTTPLGPLDVTGKYTVHSTFDLASNMPGTAGTVINTIIAATDDGDDPTHWILDQIIAQLPNGPAKTALDFGADIAAEYLNTQMTSIAPDFLETMLHLSRDLGGIAKHFGLNETLELTGAGTSYTAVHTITGVHFKLGNQEGDYAFTNYHLPNVVVGNIAVTMDPTGQLTIAAHDVPLAYGRLVRLGLDAAIIPMIDSTAHNLNELLAHLINCQAIGDGLAGVLGVSIIAGPIKSACTFGLSAAAGYIYSKIDAIDGTALTFGLNGSARAQDKNKDRKIDVIQTGAWSGTLRYGATPTALAPATFFGERN